MKDRKAWTQKTAAFFGAAFCLITIAAMEAQAQAGNARASGAERRTESMARKRDQYDRDTLDKGLKDKPLTPEEQRKALAVMAQVKHDFERIQAVYNEIVLAMAASKPLDNKFILDATAEVKKCASRLRSNLALPEPEHDEKGHKKTGDLDDDRMEESLLALRNHIMSFVTNPLFETSGVLDIELSKKASRDLDKIIEISHAINKSAHALRKK
jgi:hypothetical protein